MERPVSRVCTMYCDKQLLAIKIWPECAVYKMVSPHLLVMNADLRFRDTDVNGFIFHSVLLMTKAIN